MTVALQRAAATAFVMIALVAPGVGLRAQTPLLQAGIVACPSAMTAPSGAAAPLASASPLPATTPSATGRSRGALHIAPAGTQVNVGMCARLIVSGGTPPYVPSTAQGNVAAAAQLDGSIVIIGMRNGNDSVTITDANGITVSAPVLVAPDAGVLPAAVALQVSGAVTPDFEASALASEIARRSQLQSGARVAPISAQLLPSNLAAGVPWSGTVPVTLSGRDRWRDVTGTVPVTIGSVAMPQLDPAQLFYSDDPESVPVDQAGVLFRASLSADVPTARLYAYHLFEQAGRQLYVLLRSTGTSRVQILGASAGPSFTTYAGHVATIRYLQTRRAGQSVIVTLDADPVVLEVGSASEALRLVMGIYDLRLIDGGPVDVAVVAGFDVADPGPIALIDAPTSPPPAKDTHDRAGVYPLGAVAPIELSAGILDPKYQRANSVGSTPIVGMSVTVGASALPPVVGKRYLGGDYGLVRPFRLTMTNATDQPGTIYFYESPSVNGATMTILFDGTPPVPLESAMCLNGAPGFHDRYLLKAYTIGPTRGGPPVIVTGEYMTDGGSSYPIELGLTLDAPPPFPAKTTCGTPASP